MASRRKSVAFAALPDETEAPRSVRTRRRSAAPDVEAEATAPAVSVEAVVSKSIENDSGFKFKRRKTAKAAQPASAVASTRAEDASGLPTVVTATIPTPMPPTVVADPPVQPAPIPSKNAAETTVPPQLPPLPVATPTAPASPLKSEEVGAPRPTAVSVPSSAPPEPPSLLSGADRELLNALIEVLTTLIDDKSAHMPTMDLAIAACMGELRKLGMTRASVANEAAEAMRKREVELSARVADLESVILQWDKAADPNAMASLAPLPVNESTVMTGDAQLLATLPELPSIDAQLAELGMQASLCVEQVNATSLQLLESVRKAEQSRTQLTRATHQVTFSEYLHVDQPKTLLRALLAA